MPCTMDTKGKEQLPLTKWYEWIMAFSMVVVTIRVMAWRKAQQKHLASSFQKPFFFCLLNMDCMIFLLEAHPYHISFQHHFNSIQVLRSISHGHHDDFCYWPLVAQTWQFAIKQIRKNFLCFPIFTPSFLPLW